MDCSQVNLKFCALKLERKACRKWELQGQKECIGKPRKNLISTFAVRSWMHWNYLKSSAPRKALRPANPHNLSRLFSSQSLHGQRRCEGEAARLRAGRVREKTSAVPRCLELWLETCLLDTSSKDVCSTWPRVALYGSKTLRWNTRPALLHCQESQKSPCEIEIAHGLCKMSMKYCRHPFSKQEDLERKLMTILPRAYAQSKPSVYASRTQVWRLPGLSSPSGQACFPSSPLLAGREWKCSKMISKKRAHRRGNENTRMNTSVCI